MDKHYGTFLISEGNGFISRENRDHGFEAGTVLHDKAGKLEEFKGSDGQSADAIALKAGVTIARSAEVDGSQLSLNTDAVKTGLAANQIIVR